MFGRVQYAVMDNVDRRALFFMIVRQAMMQPYEIVCTISETLINRSPMQSLVIRAMPYELRCANRVPMSRAGSNKT